jgi:SRSO17 transposase
MNRREIDRLDRELTRYLDELFEGMGRKERRRAMAWYVTGLLLDGDRKSIEPIASRLVDDPSEIEAMRQRLQQCVSVSTWAEEDVWRRLAAKVERELPEIEALVIDDTGFPKKGEHSVGVARQYSGTLGRVDNCQVAVSLHLASERGSACIAMRLYLPEPWASDAKRCAKACVPGDVTFEPKWKLSLAQLDAAKQWGIQKRVVLEDGAYGEVTAFREGLTERGLDYVVAIPGTIAVWAPGTGPLPPTGTRAPGARGLLRTKYQTGSEKPLPVLELAASLGVSACRVLTWREGSKGRQRSRFGRVRVRTAHHHMHGAAPGDEQWLLYEWPKDEPEPTKFWLSTLGADTATKRLIHLAKLRWRVERDYQELKQEVGLDHFEGRSWPGFHHHAALCAVAHGFLALRRALFPPEPDAVDAA